ncbi:HlyD family efflux transporter periplasmic adaptor subunit [Sulfitobacter sp. JBTF-M27]|uniref:HlyD family efflux transporter periplasmic adaptor subunit n=1 Tax=Sulfitobacter sediminilitoris TaxID=2698830 RepID=A0A6P0C8N9_9RHOB|nr:HlyD family efflux transporter periplasmic adaptor subunit [Sulfitobacter sediminilitoris]NEK22571.1 HlyD family efflux transporter periplasmic adaptor subunit [Sulfitobacter sediminilitoris]
MRFLRQSMIGLFLAAMTLGLLVFAITLIGDAVRERMADGPKGPTARERIFAVNVINASASDVMPVLETFGEVQSRRQLELRAADGGRVIELADGFEDGGTVMAGQVLVRLDPADAQSAVDRAASDVLDAEAEGRDAARSLVLARDELAASAEQAALRERAFERQRDLAERGVGTASLTETAELAASQARQAVVSRRQAVAQAEARVDQAATRLARAKIARGEAERRLEDTVLRAPFDGTLSATDVIVGRLVSPNERLAELIDPNDLEVSFRLSNAQYARLLDEDGQLIRADINATLDAAGVDLVAKGRISRASAAAGEGATGRLIFALLDSAKGFKPGDFVTVRVQEPVLENVVRLPASAIGADSQVLVLDSENRLEAIPVEMLRRQGDDVLVRGPIVGRQLVEARSPLLGAGIAVKPLQRDTPISSEPEMLELSEERRARLVAFVEANDRMPEEAKARVLARLAQPRVPANMVARIESRMGG